MKGRIPDDRDMNAALHSWLTEGDEPTPDRGRQIGRIMGRVDEVRQRRRLWPLNPFGRRAVHDEEAGAEGMVVSAQGRTSALVPARAMTAVALAVLVTASLIWISSRPVEERLLPGGWAVAPSDQALFEGLATLWAGDETDLATTQEVYADDAVHDVLWLDDEEVISGNFAIWSRMRGSDVVDQTEKSAIRLVDSFSGAHRYLLVSAAEGSSLDGTACVIWMEEEQISRHDCILPLSIESVEPVPMVAPDSSTSAEREALATAFSTATSARDREAVERVVSADVVHHVLSTNQVYTLEGIDEYSRVMSLGGPLMQINVDLPAPVGELRWANFSSVGDGSLCVFWARDGLITRHDCIMPTTTTLPSGLTDVGRTAED